MEIVSQDGKVTWLYEGCRFYRCKLNLDGSLSLRCLRHGCVGRIKKFVDGSIHYITPHRHELCIAAIQQNKGTLHQGNQDDNMNEESSASLETGVGTAETNAASYTSSIIVPPQQQKEGWMYEGCRFYRDRRLNRDGSLSLRCLRRGCGGRIKTYVDGRTNYVTPHSHELCLAITKQEEEMHEGAQLDAEENTSTSVQAVIATVHTDAACTSTDFQTKHKKAYPFEGCHYYRDRVNLDGSLSLRCVRRGCGGRIKKFVDGTTCYVTQHRDELCTVELQKRMLSYEESQYQQVGVKDESSVSLQAVHGTSQTDVANIVSQTQKEGWLYEGCRYYRDRLNRDGSMSLRCVRRGCGGRIKKFVDGTTDYVSPHRHELCLAVAPQGGEALLHEVRQLDDDENDEEILQLLQSVSGTAQSDALFTDLPLHPKAGWLHEGCRYYRDRLNRDGSMSLRCVRRGCCGRIKKFVDGTTDYVTPHSNEMCTGVATSETEQIKTDVSNDASDGEETTQEMMPQHTERKRKRNYSRRYKAADYHMPASFEVICSNIFSRYIMYFSVTCFSIILL